MSKLIDVTFTDGKPNLPLCIFIHGVGMNKNIWIAPESVRVLAGNIQIKVFLSKRFLNYPLKTLYHELLERGYPCLLWSQRRPAGPLQEALDELCSLIERKKGDGGLIFIGHSRGGIVARKYVEQNPADIRLLITLGSPHSGSHMARLAKKTAKVTTLFRPFFDDAKKGSLADALRKTMALLECEALSELLPHSQLINSLKSEKPGVFKAISVSGTSTCAIIDVPEKLLLEKLLPEKLLKNKIIDRLLPEELLNEKGDGLVSLKSARLTYADEHLSYPLNHLELLFDKTLREDLLKRIEYA